MAASERRPLRADAERSIRLILEAAERVLAADPAASVEQIADAAGLARTTVHRRFANRQALVDAMSAAAVERIADAVDAARPEVVPPLVALHQITANVLRVKAGWRYALSRPATPGSATAAGWDRIVERSRELFRHTQEMGLLDEHADPEWIRRVHFALIGESLQESPRGSAQDSTPGDPDPDPDVLAARVVDTLLHGFAPRRDQALSRSTSSDG